MLTSANSSTLIRNSIGMACNSRRVTYCAM
jgi:hypothetical protein